MLAAGTTGISQTEILDALTGTSGLSKKMAFEEYLNLRTFLTSNSNKYDLQIG